MTDIKSKAKIGIKWTAIKTLFNSILQPIYRILLALLLLPSEFAYIAVIVLIVSFAELLNDIGIGEAVIQRDNVTKQELSSLYFFNLMITIIIALTLYCSSSYIEAYYSMAGLGNIVNLVTIVVFINGSTSLFKSYMHKKFHFRETSIFQIVKIIIEIIISIILIVLGFGIWGFVIGIVVSNMIHGFLLTITVFSKTDFRISPHFSYKHLYRFLNFGLFVGAKKIITFISHRIDEIIIGGVLSPELLGAYFLAKNILVQLQTLITTSFGQVLLPVFSKIKNDLNRIKQYYLRILTLVSFVGVPIFVGIILTAHLFVPIIFGNEWIESINVFKLLAIPTLAILLMAGITTSAMYALDKAFLVFKIDLLVVSSYILILILFNSGQLINIISIYSTYIIFKFIIIQYLIGKFLDINLKTYYKLFKGVGISTILMVLIIILFQYLFNLTDLIQLIIIIIIGGLTFIISNILFNRVQLMETLASIKGILKR